MQQSEYLDIRGMIARGAYNATATKAASIVVDGVVMRAGLHAAMTRGDDWTKVACAELLAEIDARAGAIGKALERYYGTPFEPFLVQRGGATGLTYGSHATVDLERKAQSTDGHEGNVIPWVLSTGVTDRSNERMDVGGIRLERYLDNPVLLWMHDQKTLPIGKGVNPRQGRDRNGAPALLMDLMFSRITELSRDVNALVAKGYLNGGSIGFIPLGWTDEDAQQYAARGEAYPHLPTLRTHKKAELLEYSVVNIPMNPDALVQRSYGVDSHLEQNVRRAVNDGLIRPDGEFIKTIGGDRLVTEAPGVVTKTPLSPDDDMTLDQYISATGAQLHYDEKAGRRISRSTASGLQKPHDNGVAARECCHKAMGALDDRVDFADVPDLEQTTPAKAFMEVEDAYYAKGFGTHCAAAKAHLTGGMQGLEMVARGATHTKALDADPFVYKAGASLSSATIAVMSRAHGHFAAARGHVANAEEYTKSFDQVPDLDQSLPSRSTEVPDLEQSATSVKSFSTDPVASAHGALRMARSECAKGVKCLKSLLSDSDPTNDDEAKEALGAVGAKAITETKGIMDITSNGGATAPILVKLADGSVIDLVATVLSIKEEHEADMRQVLEGIGEIKSALGGTDLDDDDVAVADEEEDEVDLDSLTDEELDAYLADLDAELGEDADEDEGEDALDLADLTDEELDALLAELEAEGVDEDDEDADNEDDEDDEDAEPTASDDDVVTEEVTSDDVADDENVTKSLDREGLFKSLGLTD
jgi:phage head maturation protease